MVTSSLFDGIGDPSTTIGVLIGAKKFMEGWNSWRVSNMGLLNIGRKKGSEIIQLFGRGVRLRGRGYSLKRSAALDGRHPDRDGRIVAVCLHHGQDVNAWLVREGWALAFRRYSKAYVREESEAKSARRGLWRGEFVQPWDWRRGKRLESAGRYSGTVTARNRGDCRIKGNISRNSGRRWYHVPGDPEYEKTRISTKHGERWFCSEAEARAAGWRRAKR